MQKFGGDNITVLEVGPFPEYPKKRLRVKFTGYHHSGPPTQVEDSLAWVNLKVDRETKHAEDGNFANPTKVEAEMVVECDAADSINASIEHGNRSAEGTVRFGLTAEIIEVIVPPA